MKTTDKPKPVVRLQDGKIKIAIWKNTSEKGDFYSISPPTRTFKDQEGNYQDTTSLSGTQILQAQRLLGQAYDCIRKMQSKDYANSKPSGA